MQLIVMVAVVMAFWLFRTVLFFARAGERGRRLVSPWEEPTLCLVGCALFALSLGRYLQTRGHPEWTVNGMADLLDRLRPVGIVCMFAAFGLYILASMRDGGLITRCLPVLLFRRRADVPQLLEERAASCCRRTTMGLVAASIIFAIGLMFALMQRSVGALLDTGPW